jgi:predicted ribosome-associated RNA-binding protein Tma20
LAGEEDIATLAKEMAIAVDEMDDDRKAIFLDSVSLFFRRKRERFPNVKCLIVDYEVVEVDGKWRLNVATTPLQ